MKASPFVTRAILVLALTSCDAGIPEEGTPAADDPTMPAAGGIDMGEGAGMGNATSGTVPVREVPGDQPNSALSPAAEGRDTIADLPASGADTTGSAIR